MGNTASTINKKSQQKKEEIKKALRTKVWPAYSKEQKAGRAPNQTEMFFESLPRHIKISFFESDRQVIQFGVASGKFLKDSGLADSRKCIGYDYTTESAETASENGIKHRLVDLNEMKEDLPSYKQFLDEDLDAPCDILMIRLLEYLDDQAATLLLMYLIETSQPGSIFYIEVNVAPKEEYSITNNYTIGKVPSLFSQRNDITVIHHVDFPECGNAEQYGRTEQLVVAKTCKSSPPMR